MTKTCPEIHSGTTLLDHGFFQDPNPTYQMLRDEHPVAIDPRTGFYLLTRYEDVHAAIMDPETFSSENWIEAARSTLAHERAEHNRKVFAERGYTYGANVGVLDDPRHKEVRRLFNNAFRARKVQEMESEIADIADRLIANIKAGEDIEIVKALSTPLPLLVICSQVGAPADDIWKIKRWCHAVFRRSSFVLTEAQEDECIEQELEAQHYFIDLINKLRAAPDGTILSDLVNTPLSDGRKLNDGEALNNLIYTIFVAGSETTDYAITGGVKWLCQLPELFARLKNGSDRDLANFVEEVVRLESPSSGSWRLTTRDVEMHGTVIPKGSVVHIRFGAANLDDRRFDCPHSLDLDRKSPRKHVGFGSGIHVCVGAALARAELTLTFERLLRKFNSVELVQPDCPVRYHDHYGFKSPEHMWVCFR